MQIKLVGLKTMQRADTSRWSLQIVCPACGHQGTFESTANIPDLFTHAEAVAASQTTLESYKFTAGLRMCPAIQCRALVYFQSYANGKELSTFPPSILAFSDDGVPTTVSDSFKEALRCFACGLFKSAAMMIRKTLEEICYDINCSGKTLEKRIDQLKATNLLPPTLMDSLHDIRYLGNDAAHIKSKTFNQVGQEEVALGIRAMLKIIDNLYQVKKIKQEIDKRKAINLQQPVAP